MHSRIITRSLAKKSSYERCLLVLTVREFLGFPALRLLLHPFFRPRSYGSPWLMERASGWSLLRREVADWQPNRARGKVQMCMKHLKFHILFTYLINMTINMKSACLNCFVGGWGGPTPWEGDLCSRRTIVSLLCLVKTWRNLFWELLQ